MKKNFYIITAVLIIIVIFIFVRDRNKFNISDLKWGYNKDIFNVSFTVHNKTKNELSNRLRISAYKDKYLGKAIVTDLVGEEMITVILLPGEIKKINEELNLQLELSPDKVFINVLD